MADPTLEDAERETIARIERIGAGLERVADLADALRGAIAIAEAMVAAAIRMEQSAQTLAAATTRLEAAANSVRKGEQTQAVEREPVNRRDNAPEDPAPQGVDEASEPAIPAIDPSADAPRRPSRREWAAQAQHRQGAKPS